MMTWLPLAASIATFLAIALTAFALTGRAAGARRRKALAGLDAYAPHSTAPTSQRARQQSPVALDVIAAAFVRGGYRDGLTERAQLAGIMDEEHIQALLRRKILYALGLSAVCLLLALIAPSILTVSLAIFSPFLGFFLPDILLHNQVLRRSEEIGRELADTLDLLTLCVRSGLSFEQALEQVTTTQQGAMSEEFARVLRELQLGQSRSQALESLASRNRQPELLRFISAMLQADRLGIPIGDVLSEQTREMRHKRRENAREQAQKVPVKILMPVMGCFLPGLVIIVIGPAVVAIIKVFAGF
jgi:tight adherence protein C